MLLQFKKENEINTTAGFIAVEYYIHDWLLFLSIISPTRTRFGFQKSYKPNNHAFLPPVPWLDQS